MGRGARGGVRDAPVVARVGRFSRAERAVHWSFTAGFVVLLGTGLVLWVPQLAALVGQREVLRRFHVWTGLGLVPVPLLLGLALDPRGLLRTARELERFDGDDRDFLLRRHGRPDRFNGGQRLNTWWTVTSAVLFLLSGVVQWQWTRFSPAWRTGASELHDLLTVLAALVLAGHLYLALLHRSTRHATRGIVSGWVRSDWARDHHPRWLDRS